MVECVWSIIRKFADFAEVVLIAKPPWNQLEIIPQSEILRLFVDHLLKAFNATNGHLDAQHHI